MKLREYLEQFKDLDPELEVFGYDEHDKICLVKKEKSYTYAFAMDKIEDFPYYRFKQSKDFNTKILIIS